MEPEQRITTHVAHLFIRSHLFPAIQNWLNLVSRRGGIEKLNSAIFRSGVVWTARFLYPNFYKRLQKKINVSFCSNQRLLRGCCAQHVFVKSVATTACCATYNSEHRNCIPIGVSLIRA